MLCPQTPARTSVDSKFFLYQKMRCHVIREKNMSLWSLHARWKKRPLVYNSYVLVLPGIWSTYWFARFDIIPRTIRRSCCLDMQHSTNFYHDLYLPRDSQTFSKTCFVGRDCNTYQKTCVCSRIFTIMLICLYFVPLVMAYVPSNSLGEGRSMWGRFTNVATALP